MEFTKLTSNGTQMFTQFETIEAIVLLFIEAKSVE